MHDAAELERRGIPTVTFVAGHFATLARFERQSLGLPELPFVVIDYPVSGISSEEARRRSAGVFAGIVAGLTDLAAAGVAAAAAPKEAFAFVDLEDDSLDAVNQHFDGQRWGDGLPLVPPTAERVAEMLRHSDRPWNSILGNMPPRWRPCTVHHLAVNAVMAGCRPEYFPVIVAGVEAMLDPLFNLNGVQATTNPCGVMLLVNGPIARELDVNCGFNLFGQGWRANATIGRAIRLAMINIGGGLPGLSDMSTLGNPGKYSGCFAENEAASPWQPFHVQRGYSPDTSTVTAIGTAAPQNLIDMSADATSIATTIARAMLIPGSNCTDIEGERMIVIGPTHARHLARGGFDKATLRQFIWEQSKIEVAGLSETGFKIIRTWRSRSIKMENGKEMLYAAPVPEQISLVVAGGDVGPHSAILPTFNGTHLVTRLIALRGGTPLTLGA